MASWKTVHLQNKPFYVVSVSAFSYNNQDNARADWLISYGLLCQ